MMARALRRKGSSWLISSARTSATGTRPRPRSRSTGGSTRSSRPARDPMPESVRFTTWTLRYNRSFWVQVDGLEQHWERAKVEADLLGEELEGTEVRTKNVSAFTLSIPPGRFPRHPRAARGQDRRGDRRGPAGRSPTARGRPISARSTATGRRSRRTTTAPCASGMACKAPSTTPSWTAS